VSDARGGDNGSNAFSCFFDFFLALAFLFCLERLEEDLQVDEDLMTAAFCRLLEGVFDLGM